VLIEIAGNEKTKWVSTDGKGSKKHKSKHGGKNLILLSKYVIPAFPKGEAEPGQYSFPFTFQIPSHLPSSLVYFGQEQKTSFAIKY
jgi:Arrestin (or S-antigen), N-terminal domain